jgi:hypothetical protein
LGLKPTASGSQPHPPKKGTAGARDSPTHRLVRGTVHARRRPRPGTDSRSAALHPKRGEAGHEDRRRHVRPVRRARRAGADVSAAADRHADPVPDAARQPHRHRRVPEPALAASISRDRDPPSAPLRPPPHLRVIDAEERPARAGGAHPGDLDRAARRDLFALHAVGGAVRLGDRRPHPEGVGE